MNDTLPNLPTNTNNSVDITTPGKINNVNQTPESQNSNLAAPTPPVKVNSSFFKPKLFFLFLPIVFIIIASGAYLYLKQPTAPTSSPTATATATGVASPSDSLVTKAPLGSPQPITINDKWKLWNDPNAFFIKYPPLTQINHLNELTTVQRRSQNGLYTISFCRNCTRLACEGDCQKNADITVTVGQNSKTQKQIWPSAKGFFTFQVLAKYPSKFKEEFLLISAEYENETALEEINLILSTFDWKEKATPTPTSAPSPNPTATPDYY